MNFFEFGNTLMFILVVMNMGLFYFGFVDLPGNQELFPFLSNTVTVDFNFDQNAIQSSDYLQQDLSHTGSITAATQTTPLPQSQVVFQQIGSIFTMAATFPFWGIYAMQKAQWPSQIIVLFGGILLFIQGLYILFLGLEIWKALPRGGS